MKNSLIIAVVLVVAIVMASGANATTTPNGTPTCPDGTQNCTITPPCTTPDCGVQPSPPCATPDCAPPQPCPTPDCLSAPAAPNAAMSKAFRREFGGRVTPLRFRHMRSAR
jgi:hypothetical protein